MCFNEGDVTINITNIYPMEERRKGRGKGNNRKLKQPEKMQISSS